MGWVGEIESGLPGGGTMVDHGMGVPKGGSDIFSLATPKFRVARASLAQHQK